MQCRSCGKAVNVLDWTCPHCGSPRLASELPTILFLLPFFFCAVSILIGLLTHEPSSRTDYRDRDRFENFADDWAEDMYDKGYTQEELEDAVRSAPPEYWDSLGK